jgi:hypothetical protein
MELLIIVIGMVVLAAFAAAANVLGVDSRELSDDPHRSSYPVSLA